MNHLCIAAASGSSLITLVAYYSNLVPLNGDPNFKYGGVTASVYVELLEEYLPMIMDPDTIFMQDNAPIYTVRVIKGFFEKWAI